MRAKENVCSFPPENWRRAAERVGAGKSWTMSDDQRKGVADCWIEAEKLKNSDPMYNCVSLSASVWYTTKTKMLTMDIFVIQIQSASVQYTTKRTMYPVYIYVIHPDTKYRGVMQNDSKLCHRQSILLCILSVAVSSVIHCWFTTFLPTISSPANSYPLCSTVRETQS